jgi:hypothetical protein
MKPRLTLDDVLFDLRSRGLSMSKGDLSRRIEDGSIPIGTVTRNTLRNGRPSMKRVFCIFAVDYLAWANKYAPRGGILE